MKCRRQKQISYSFEVKSPTFENGLQLYVSCFLIIELKLARAATLV